MKYLTLLAISGLLVSSTSASDDRVHGSLFTSDPGAAAKQSSPFWFFGRSSNREPCYPENAAPGGKPHPGTKVPISDKQGEGCPSPGPWTGTYSLGNSFPTYYAVKYCPNDDSWRINYNIYFSHDGYLSAGHRHDWEWVAAIWKKCDVANDMWCRDRLVRSFHREDKHNSWDGIQNTINTKEEIRNLGDKNKHHPLIYVGAFKHAMFDTRKTSMNWYVAGGGDEIEFRSNDWYYWAGDNFVNGNTIDRNWDYGEAASSPMRVWDGICDK